MDYGMNVTWKADETGAFLIFHKLCAEQARAVFAAKACGKVAPPIVPAAKLAEIARAQAAA
jgi:hypothetical protein